MILKAGEYPNHAMIPDIYFAYDGSMGFHKRLVIFRIHNTGITSEYGPFNIDSTSAETDGSLIYGDKYIMIPKEGGSNYWTLLPEIAILYEILDINDVVCQLCLHSNVYHYGPFASGFRYRHADTQPNYSGYIE